jgi:mannitol/fructose-specific phosphotransferase system IIA component (Ntr-type)
MEILANLSMKFIDDDFQKNISKVKDFAGLMKLLK